jgi:hypothetical protein
VPLLRPPASGHPSAVESPVVRYLIASVVLILGITQTALSAQQQPAVNRIALGPLEIALGDDHARTLDKLRSRYTLSQQGVDGEPVGTTGSWHFTTPKGDDSGRVAFRYGKVDFVFHRSVPLQTALDVSLAFGETIHRLVQDGRRECEIFVNVDSDPAAPELWKLGVGPVLGTVLHCGWNRVSMEIEKNPTQIVVARNALVADDGR